MDSREKELKETALTFIRELLNLNQGERLLIYIDQGSDLHTTRVIQEGAQQIGALVEIFELNSTLTHPEMAEDLTEKIEEGTFDAICELSEQYFYQTLAWERALKSGSRIYSIGGLDANAFIRCVGKVDNNLMFQFGMVLKRILSKAKTIQICTNKGTNITFRINSTLFSRVISRLQRRRTPYIMYPSGMPPQRGQATFMGGQLAFQGFPETIEGTAVIDGYFWPPQEIGLIDDPIILRIKKGSVVEISGYSKKSRVLNQWFIEKTKDIQHFCIGYNPGAKLSGKLLECERVFGCISIGIGEYPFHTDGVIKSPSIILNNEEIIEKDGSFIHEELSDYEKIMLQEKQN